MERKYGINRQDYDAMRAQQEYCCAICGMHEDDAAEIHGVKAKYRKLAIDHCHESGNVRGLLCVRCNLMIGYALDNTRILDSGMTYLRTARAKI